MNTDNTSSKELQDFEVLLFEFPNSLICSKYLLLHWFVLQDVLGSFIQIFKFRYSKVKYVKVK